LDTAEEEEEEDEEAEEASALDNRRPLTNSSTEPPDFVNLMA
jgi:hypothetical protein